MSKRSIRLCLTLAALALAAVLCCPAALAAAPGQTARTQAAASSAVSSAAASDTAPAPEADRAPAAAASGGAGLALSVAALLVSALSVTGAAVLVAVHNRSQNAADRKTLQALKELQQQVRAMEEQMAQLTRQPLTDPLAAPAPVQPAQTPAAQTAKPILAHAAPAQPASTAAAQPAAAQPALATAQPAAAQPAPAPAQPAAPAAQPAAAQPAAPAPAPLALYIVGRENVADNTTGLPYYAARPGDPQIRVYDDNTARLHMADYQNIFLQAANLVQKGFLAVFDVYVNGQPVTGKNCGAFGGYLQLESMERPARLDPAAIHDGQRVVVLQKGVTHWKTDR